MKPSQTLLDQFASTEASLRAGAWRWVWSYEHRALMAADRYPPGVHDLIGDILKVWKGCRKNWYGGSSNTVDSICLRQSLGNTADWVRSRCRGSYAHCRSNCRRKQLRALGNSGYCRCIRYISCPDRRFYVFRRCGNCYRGPSARNRMSFDIKPQSRSAERAHANLQY